MAMIDAQKFTDRWAAGMAAAGTKYKEGVQAVTEAPNAKAAQAESRYLAGTQEAVASGAYQRGNQAVTLEDWKNAAITKGAARLAGGAQAAVPKMRAAAGPLLAHIESGMSLLQSMPRGTFEENMQRSIAMATHMHSFKKAK